MTFNTGNPIGSTDARDRFDNSENMDILENSTTLNAHPDRLGVMRKTRKGMESEHDNQMQSFESDFDSRLAGMAFTRVGTFAAGYTLADARQVLLCETDGHEYGWTGAFPKVVTPASTPAGTGGIGAGVWVDRTDVTLRSEINVIWRSFACVADIDGNVDVGCKVAVENYHINGDSGMLFFTVVAAGTGTHDGGCYIDLPTSSLQLKQNLKKPYSVKAWGAVGDGVTDDTYPIQKALNLVNASVWLPFGKYKITSALGVGSTSLLGEGCLYNSPYSSSEPQGVVLIPYGMQNSACIYSAGVTVGNKVKIGGFAIDMSNMTSGTSSDDFTSSCTKGVFVENKHAVDVFDIEIYKVPTNACGFMFKSGAGGSYWGKKTNLAVRTKLSSSSDATAKGFVLWGDTDSLTAQTFEQCTSYRGWYLKSVNNSQFIDCSAENNPKDGWYIDGGNALTFIGGFQEGQGNEDATRTYYQFYGVNSPKRVTLIGGTISGNGISGLTAGNGFIRLNFGGASADQMVNRLANLHLDSVGNINLLGNSAALLYGASFNSTVPASTNQTLYFKYSTAGFDKLAEYNESSGNYTFKLPANTFGDGNGIYAIDVDLEFKNAGSTALTSGYSGYFVIGGGGWAGFDKVYGYTNGSKYLIVRGRLLVKVTNQSQGGAYLTFSFYHNYTESLVMTNSNGAASVSRVMVTKVQ